MSTQIARLIVKAALGFSCLSTLLAQDPVLYTRDTCLKVQPGKNAEYAAMVHDVSAKLAQVSVENGTANWWLAARAVAPTGTSARCDYHIVNGYIGFPPEPPSGPSAMEANLKKANIHMTAAELGDRRNTLSRLVSVDTWRTVALAGGRVEKGSYVRLNMYKAKPGQTMSDWVKLETEGWKPLAESFAKESPGSGWTAAALVMPGGSSLPYQAMTVDIFPNWAAVGKGLPMTTLWPKVHADMSMDDYMARVNNVVDRPRVDLFQVVEMVRAK